MKIGLVLFEKSQRAYERTNQPTNERINTPDHNTYPGRYFWPITRGVQKVLQLDHIEEWKCYKLHFIFQYNLY